MKISEIHRSDFIEHFLNKWSIPLLIILSIFIFNFVYLFTDTLWHDDGWWYYFATEGLNLRNLIPWRAKISILLPYFDLFYSYSMVYIGVTFTRGVYVLVMGLSSLSLFYLYRNAFGFNTNIAIPASVIPNILPSLIGIPVSLNSSYAIWGLLPILISLNIIQKAFKTCGIRSFCFIIFAFIIYFIGLNLSPSANFLIPCVLLIFLIYFPVNKIRSIFYVLPFIMVGLWQVNKQIAYSHLQPTRIPLAEVMGRVGKFFEMASFLPFNMSFSLYITIGLMLCGILGLLTNYSGGYQKPNHFMYSSHLYRLLIMCWPLCWLISNSVAYVAFSPDFRENDYAYIFNFSSVFLQIIGLMFLLTTFLYMLRTSVSLKKRKIAFVFVVCIILITGIQRIQYRYNAYGWKPNAEADSKFIREHLKKIVIPYGAQIIVLGMNTWHPGNPQVNSGFLRYLLNRKDISGLIGFEKYPNDVFEKWTSWFDSMQGLSKEKPIIAFRHNGDTLVRVNLMLQVLSTGQKGLPRLQWTLYEIGAQQELPKKLASGKGMSSYNTYFTNDLPTKLQGKYIAFAPQGKADEFIDKIKAEQLIEMGGLLNKEIKIGSHFTLRNISALKVKQGYELEAIVRIDSFPQKGFKLGYRLNKKDYGNQVALWKYAMQGDHLLLRLPVFSEREMDKGILFELMDVGVWPFKTMAAKGGVYDQEEGIIVRLGNDT